MQTQPDLLKDPIPRLLRQLAIPASTGMFFNTMYNVVDTFYAGLISTYAIAALSLSFMFFFVIVGAGYGFSSAITALVGNALGQKKATLASMMAHSGLSFIFLLGLLFSCIGFMIAPSFFIFLGASEAYLQLGLDYIHVILYGTVFFMANFALNAILVSKGDTKSYRNSLIFGFFANLILNPLFIYGFLFVPALGIQGIAYATVLIQVINMLYLLSKVLKTRLVTWRQWHYFIPNSKLYKKIIAQGIPSSLNMLTMSFGSLILLYYVSTYGHEAVAGYGIGYRVEQLMLLPALGLSTATLSIVSNNFGAKQYSRVGEVFKTALLYGYGISLFGVIFLTLFGELIVQQFDENSNVIAFGMEYLRIEVWIFFAFVTLFVCVSTLQGIKRPKMIFYVGLYRQIIAKFLVAYIIVTYLQWDYSDLWLGILCMIYSAAIFMYWYTQRQLRVYQ